MATKTQGLIDACKQASLKVLAVPGPILTAIGTLDNDQGAYGQLPGDTEASARQLALKGLTGKRATIEIKLEEYGKLVNEFEAAQKALHKHITTKEIFNFVKEQKMLDAAKTAEKEAADAHAKAKRKHVELEAKFAVIDRKIENHVKDLPSKLSGLKAEAELDKQDEAALAELSRVDLKLYRITLGQMKDVSTLHTTEGAKVKQAMTEIDKLTWTAPLREEKLQVAQKLYSHIEKPKDNLLKLLGLLVRDHEALVKLPAAKLPKFKKKFASFDTDCRKLIDAGYKLTGLMENTLGDASEVIDDLKAMKFDGSGPTPQEIESAKTSIANYATIVRTSPQSLRADDIEGYTEIQQRADNFDFDKATPMQWLKMSDALDTLKQLPSKAALSVSNAMASKKKVDGLMKRMGKDPGVATAAQDFAKALSEMNSVINKLRAAQPALIKKVEAVLKKKPK